MDLPPSYEEAMELNIPPPRYSQLFGQGPSSDVDVEIQDENQIQRRRRNVAQYCLV